MNEANEASEGMGHDHHHMRATKEKNADEALSTIDKACGQDAVCTLGREVGDHAPASRSRSAIWVRLLSRAQYSGVLP